MTATLQADNMWTFMPGPGAHVPQVPPSQPSRQRHQSQTISLD